MENVWGNRGERQELRWAKELLGWVDLPPRLGWPVNLTSDRLLQAGPHR